MAAFISTIKFTDQGIKAIGETTRRAAAIKTAAKKMDVNLENVYWTLGTQDGLLIFTAPDDETAAAFLLYLGSQGNVQTASSRAFTAAEMDQMLGKIPG